MAETAYTIHTPEDADLAYRAREAGLNAAVALAQALPHRYSLDTLTDYVLAAAPRLAEYLTGDTP